MTKQIIIEVAPDGKIIIEAVGFKGNACEQATKAMEEALGLKTGGKKKPEYYQANLQTGWQKVGS